MRVEVITYFQDFHVSYQRYFFGSYLHVHVTLMQDALYMYMLHVHVTLMQDAFYTENTFKI